MSAEARLCLDEHIAETADDIDLDLTFQAAETGFRNILSIVPGMFTEQFGDIETDGKMAFKGYVKGRFNDTSLPGFGTMREPGDAALRQR